MSVTFFDLQNEHNPQNACVIGDNSALDALFRSLSDRPAFLCELVGTEGYKLLLGIGQNIGCAQYSPGDNRPPYCMAVGDDAAENDSFAEFLTGNAPTQIPLRYSLPIDKVDEIAHHFLRTGERLDTVDWEEI